MRTKERKVKDKTVCRFCYFFRYFVSPFKLLHCLHLQHDPTGHRTVRMKHSLKSCGFREDFVHFKRMLFRLESYRRSNI